MKTYRKTAQLLNADLSKLQPELMKELLYNIWLIETNYLDDKNAVVLLLNNEQELTDVYNAYPYLEKIEPEIDERTWCENDTLFRKTVWITGQDGSGIVVLYETCR